MSYVEWKRKGEWMEKNSLIISGYSLTDKNEFIESPGISTIINPVDFDEFCSIEFNYKKVDDGVEFILGDKTYCADIPLFNSILTVAAEILWDAADTFEIDYNIIPETPKFELRLV